MSKRLSRFLKFFVPQAGTSTPPYSGPYQPAVIEADTMNGSVTYNNTGRTQYEVQGSPANLTTGGIFTGSSLKQSAVIPFRLPYLPPGQTLSGATFTFVYTGKAGPPNFSVDCYGMARQSTTCSDVVQADYYDGASDGSNTLLASSIVTTSTATGSTITVSGAALVSWLQSQYTAAGNNGLTPVWVFLRLSANATPTTGGNYNYTFASANNVTRSLVPTLSLTATGAPTATAGSLIFTFNLGTSAYTSAGVFDGSGNLKRTIWSNVPYAAGYNVGAWDGKDDSGNTLSGAYTIKVLSHNVAYAWDGILGNTSASQTGVNVWRSLSTIQGMCLGGSKMYFANGYEEQIAQFGSFAVGSPQVPTQVFPSGTASDYENKFGPCASDGTTVFFAKQSGSVYQYTFIIGMNISTGNLVTFSSGSSSGNSDWPSVIDLDTASGQPNPASSLAVDNNFLYACHPNLGQIRVFNKTTGALVNTITTFGNPVSVSWDTTTNIYVLDATAGTLSYATINPSTGAVTTSAVLISGLTGALYHDSDHTSGASCAIALNNNQVNVYTYNSGTGNFALVTTLGTAGGQPTIGPTLTNTDFWFGGATWIAFQSATDFWVADPNNQRYQHYTINIGANTCTYVESIIYRNTSYCTDVETSAGVRLFSGFFEYSINYANAPGGLNGSWSFVKNWFANCPSDASHNYKSGTTNDGINSPCTLSNGRTYALAYNGLGNSGSGSYDMVELTSTGLRVCGGSLTWGGKQPPRLYPDGSLRYQTYTSNVNTFFKQLVTGFDGSNNPILGTATTLAHATTSGLDTNLNAYGSLYTPRIECTSGGIYPVFRADGGKGWHLGGIATGGSAWQWEALPSVTISGRLWIPTNAIAGNTVTIRGTAYTCVASGASGAQFNLGASAAATIQNIAAAVAANDTDITTIYDSGSVTFTVAANVSGVGASTNISGAYWNQNVWNNQLSYGGGASRAGIYDIGNNVATYFGNLMNVCANTIICGYQGEGWKNSEADLWHHFHESGLYLGTFGTPTIYAGGNTPGMVVAGQGGNSFYSTVVSVGGNYYLYYNDEAGLGGVGRFKINNLTSIAMVSGSGSTGSVVPLS